MTAHKETGGPAFPMTHVTVLAEDGTPNESCEVRHEGMTLRDYFAAHAPQDDVERFYETVKVRKYIDVEPSGYHRVNWRRPDNARYIARYMYADAMLKARKDK